MTWCGGTDIGDRLSESQMTFDKVFHGVLDQGHGCLLIFEEQEADLRRPYVVYQIVVYEDADLRAASQRMVPRLSRVALAKKVMPPYCSLWRKSDSCSSLWRVQTV